MKPLDNPRHERFAQALAKGMSATAAYEEVGYRPSMTNAARLSRNEQVRARVAYLTDRASQRVEIDVARVLAELARIGFSDVRKLFDESGALKPVHALDDATAAAVASVEVVSRGVKGPDGETEVEYTHKVKLWDKNTALDKIAKHLGMMVERVQHDATDKLAELLRDARPLPVGLTPPPRPETETRH